MKKSVALLIGLILALSVTAPALAYTGVDGTVRDSKIPSAWEWGGDVYIRISGTTSFVATCMLETTPGPTLGQIVGSLGSGAGSCTWGSAAVFPANAPVPVAGQSLEVVIDFSCALSSNCSGGPDGTPDPITVPAIPFVQDASGVQYALGDIPTGTGPNAVQLAGMNGTSGLGVALVLAMVAGGSLLVKSTAKNEPDNAYAVPEVIYEGVLEVQAGSPLSDISGGILPDDL
ncbi:MAG: hypothetical protein E4H27_00295 [Anaerolineales bacterium]|nr:MAG: hypothetical protein E4H27_00295 [Anaerolineales bacterium]